MKSVLLVFLLLMLVVCLLVAFMALFDKAWTESACMGVWALIIERAGEHIHKDMK